MKSNNIIEQGVNIDKEDKNGTISLLYAIKKS